MGLTRRRGALQEALACLTNALIQLPSCAQGSARDRREIAIRLVGPPSARTAKRLVSSIEKAILNVPEARIDYIEAIDAETLEAPGKHTRHLLIALAVFFGTTRLIDNLEIDFRSA